MTIDLLADAPSQTPLPTKTRRLFVPAVKAGLPGLVFLGVRAIGIGVWELLALPNHRPINLRVWDANWYLEIARHGYLGVDPAMMDAFGHRSPDTPMVFFPGYPLAVRILAYPLFGQFTAAAVVVSLAGGFAAAMAVHRLANLLVVDIPRAGTIAVVLFAAMPMSVVTGLAYPEGLLLGLVGWALVGMVEHRWWITGPCVLAAGYVSPMALPLVAVTVAAGFHAARTARAWWWPCAAAVTASWGTAGYVVWVSFTARTQSYLTIQRAGWGSHIDGGLSAVRWLWQAIALDTATFTTVTAIVTFAAVALTVVLARARPPWEVWVYTALTVAFILVTAGIQWDKARLLLSAFPILLPLVRIVGRQRPHVAWAWVVGLAAFGLWFSAYSLTAWHYSI